jgi:nucleoside-diphosphate-sugar epimerase
VIRYAQSCSDRNNIYLQCFTQILGVTADNASNNDKMIEHLATLIENFPGAANQTRCFTHILNLVAKSVLRQFEAPKSKGRNVLDDAARELATIFDDLEDDDVDLNDDAESDGGGNEDSGEGDEDVDDDVVDDDDDGLPDEREGMSEEELANLEKSVKLVRLVLTKVRHIN